jgi:hypothetical protein
MGPGYPYPGPVSTTQITMIMYRVYYLFGEMYAG